jgi:hypothetical protein
MITLIGKNLEGSEALSLYLPQGTEENHENLGIVNVPAEVHHGFSPKTGLV